MQGVGGDHRAGFGHACVGSYGGRQVEFGLYGRRALDYCGLWVSRGSPVGLGDSVGLFLWRIFGGVVSWGPHFLKGPFRLGSLAFFCYLLIIFVF